MCRRDGGCTLCKIMNVRVSKRYLVGSFFNRFFGDPSIMLLSHCGFYTWVDFIMNDGAFVLSFSILHTKIISIRFLEDNKT